jgi:hypothetical protein
MELNEKGKLTKIPKNPKTGGNALPNTPSTWGSIEAALIGIETHNFEGIGFEFSKDDPFTGIDLDKCVNAAGELEPWAQQIVDRLDSYVEASPSGKGIHIIVKGSLPPDGRKKGKIECYDQGRFFTVTGNVLNGCSAIAERHAELKVFHKEIFGAQKEAVANHPVMPVEPLDLADEELLSLALNADDGGKFSKLWAGDWKGAGYPSPSEGDMGLCCKLAFWTGRDRERMNRLFRQSGLYRQKKWNRADYSGKTLDRAINLCDEVYKPPRHKSEPCNGDCPPIIEWPEGYLESPPDSQVRVSQPEPNSRKLDKPKPEKQCAKTPISATFPFNALSGLALRFAELYSSYTEPPLQFYYFSFLTCLGSVLADKVTLDSQIEPQPRLYTLLLGESADDRKSTAIDQTAKFFRAFAVEKILNVCHGLGSAEGLQARMDETKGPDGIARLILFFDEFKSFVSKCKIEGSVLLPCVTTLFESNRYESRTKNSNIQLNKAHLSLLAASTLQTFENVWTSQFTDIGFGNRLWIVTGRGERRFSIPRKIPESDLYQLKRKLNEILSQFSERFEMIVDPDAFALYDKWYLALEPSVHAKRIDTYALRLMPLLAANDAKSHVDLETVRKVTQLCDWQLQIRKLYDPIDSDNAIAKMEEKIRRNLGDKGPLKEWQLKQVTQANRAGLFVFNNAIKNLRGAHEIGWDRTTKSYFEGLNENS